MAFKVSVSGHEGKEMRVNALDSQPGEGSGQGKAEVRAERNVQGHREQDERIRT